MNGNARVNGGCNYTLQYARVNGGCNYTWRGERGERSLKWMNEP